MILESTEIEGVCLVRQQPHVDDRGHFVRTFCSDEFSAAGLPSVFEQSSISRNRLRGTLRGMHYQNEPYAEAKFVRCIRGAIVDVVVDIRRQSLTYGKWKAVRLDAERGDGLYIAPGLAHGFQTLTDDTDVLYQITPAFSPGHGSGVRWNDTAFGIRWPIADPLLSPRDATYADWVP